MKIKKIITVAIMAMVISATVALPTLAADSTVSVDTTTEASGNNAIANFRKAANEQAKIIALKNAGDKLIEARISTLNKLVSTIAAANIDATVKSSLTASVEAQISQLNSIKSSIDSETALETLKIEVKSIYPSHYIYALFVPMIHGQLVSAKLSAVVANLSSQESKIETFLAQLKSVGTDTTAGDTAYADYKAQLATASSAIASANNSFKSIDLTNITTGQQVRVAGRSSIDSAKAALTKAKTDLQTITALAK